LGEWIEETNISFFMGPAKVEKLGGSNL